MNRRSLHDKARRVTRFVFVQFFALSGWIAVQLFFSFTPLGRSLSFPTLMFTEAIWWLALLLIMLHLFLVEYHRFVRAALDLEDANRRLRQRTNSILEYLQVEHAAEEQRTPQNQE